MAQLLKDTQIIDDQWIRVPADAEVFPAGDILVHYNDWQTHQDELNQHQGAVGVWFDGNEEIEAFAESLVSLPLIAINFPKFVDGRGFSVARLLRERYGFKGELRAVGQIIRDQLFLLHRCGFNAFQFEDNIDLDQAVKSLTDFSDSYQVAVDQPQPLFKRR